MAKTTKLIPGTILASVLSVPAVPFAHSVGPLTRDELCAAPVHLQCAQYHDSESTATKFPMNLKAAMARMEAQRQVFVRYGGISSSSAPPSHVGHACAERAELDT